MSDVNRPRGTQEVQTTIDVAATVTALLSLASWASVATGHAALGAIIVDPALAHNVTILVASGFSIISAFMPSILAKK